MEKKHTELFIRTLYNERDCANWVSLYQFLHLMYSVYKDNPSDFHLLCIYFIYAVDNDLIKEMTY